MGIRGYVWTTWSIMSQAAAAFSFKQDPISVLTHLVVQYVSVKHVSLDLHYRTTVSEQIIRTGTKQATNQLKKIQAIFFGFMFGRILLLELLCVFSLPLTQYGSDITLSDITTSDITTWQH